MFRWQETQAGLSSACGGGGGGRGLTFLYVTPASSCVSGPPEHKNITTTIGKLKTAIKPIDFPFGLPSGTDIEHRVNDPGLMTSLAAFTLIYMVCLEACREGLRTTEDVELVMRLLSGCDWTGLATTSKPRRNYAQH